MRRVALPRRVVCLRVEPVELLAARRLRRLEAVTPLGRERAHHGALADREAWCSRGIASRADGGAGRISRGRRSGVGGGAGALLHALLGGGALAPLRLIARAGGGR